MRPLLSAIVLLSSTLLSACEAGAPGGGTTASSGLTRVEGLGSLIFPTSGRAEAQPAFLRGVLLLHSFEYEPAAEAFREAQAADPDFAMAFWGEAMTYNHPLWGQQDVEAARAVLERLGATPEARAARAPTERERGYLAAVEALYEEGTKEERDRAYLREMAALQDAYPADMEARAFHALAILGSRDGARDFATYMRAAATAQPVFDDNPDHPGAAHYLIHSFDDPVHAPLGLPAARRYAEIAPEASHAQHMTSHIFVALGMWDDVVAANIRARDTQDAQNLADDGRANVCGHYSSWLQYGHLMRGEVDEAAALLDRCHARMSDSPSNGERGYFASMRARQILDTEDWSLADRWRWPEDDHEDVTGRAAADYDFVNAFAALRRGDAGPARRLAAGPAPSPGEANVQYTELRGLVAIADGRLEAGLAALRQAAGDEDAMPFAFGPPAVLKPAHELLGEELLRAGFTEHAVLAFEREAERTPGRTLATRGLQQSRDRSR
jgi:tetratricopeptide (TPR) repeat protein